MKLYRFKIETYYFGSVRKTMYVLASSEERAKDIVFQHPEYANDIDARIVEIVEVDMNKEGVI